MTKARENSDYTGLAADIVAGDTAARAGRKNLILNGSMQISQRGDYTTASAATNDSYSLDRWRDWGGIAKTFQHTTGLTINGTTNKKGFKYVATAASSASYMGARQKLEGEDVPNGVVVTFSCMMRTNNANARIRTYGIVNGGVTSAACPSDGNWHKVTLTQTTNTVGTPEVGVLVYNGNETTTSIAVGDYIEVADFQLELGSVATDFEHRSYGEELAGCQRFFEVLSSTSDGNGNRYNGVAWDSSNLNIFIPFKVTKRSSPTVTISNHGDVYNGSWVNGTGSAVTGASLRGCTISIQKSGGYTLNKAYFIKNQAITVSAEL